MTNPVNNVFTIDLEDWFHGLTSTNRQPEIWPGLESRVVQNTLRLLELLAEYGIKATFFVLGEVAASFPDLIQQIDAAGHEIGVHGFAHKKVHDLTPTEFAAELDRTLSLLQPLVNQEIIGHRAPYFSINENTLWAVNTLCERGFQYDSSFFPTRNMLYGYPKAPRFPHRIEKSEKTKPGDVDHLIEFPLSTVRFLGVTWPVAGGFYIRTLPYPVVHQAIKRLNHQGKPAIIYMHPWELDIHQSKPVATLRERITHYHGRKGLESKLRRLFTDFLFQPLGDLLVKLREDEQER